MKILVVDDDVISQVTILKTLEYLGYEAFCVDSGPAALDLHRKEHVNVIVSDWLMPQMDGIQLCREIRTIQTAHYPYFILVSSTHLQPEQYAAATKEGIDDFLTKPLDTGDIANRLLVANRIIRFTSEIRRLKDLLPICMYCHKIRNDADYWLQIEKYIMETTGASFTHGVCPACFQEHVEPMLPQEPVENP